MSPVLHTAAPPIVLGDSLRGKRPHDYGRGRVCARPGCTTILRRTHAGPVCDPCQDNDHVAAPRRGAVAARRAHNPEIAGSNPAAATNQQSGPPASACSEDAPKAAPAVRATKEEKGPRDELHNRSEEVLKIMRDGRWWTAAELGERLGVSRQRVFTLVKELRKAGHVFEAQAGQGTRLVEEKLRAHSDEGEESAKTAPASPPALAPVIPPPERTADVAPAPAPETPLEPVPAAGDLDYFNGLRRDWYDGKAEMDVDQLFAFATRMRDELLGKLTRIKQCHVYRLPVVAGDLATGEVGVHWIDGLDQSEVSAAIHDSEAPGVYESVDWKAGPPESPAAGLRPFAGIETKAMEASWLCKGFAGFVHSRELRVITDLEEMEDGERERVLQYAVDRWPGKLDIVREIKIRYPSPDKLVTQILDVLDRYARTAS